MALGHPAEVRDLEYPGGRGRRLVSVALCRGGAHQRICFSGIGSLSHHVVSGPSSQVLSGSVAELFIPFLQQEGNSVWPGEHGFGPILAHGFSVGLLKAGSPPELAVLGVV